MALRLWMPCVDDLRNQGLSNVSPSGSNYSVSGDGKLCGNCVKTSSSGSIDTGLAYDKFDYAEGSVSLCGWFKISLSDVQSAVESFSYDSSYPDFAVQLFGNCAFGGVGIHWVSNDINSDGSLTGGSLVFSFRREKANDTVGDFISGSYTYLATTPYSMAFDTWYHVAGVLDRARSAMTLYVNGVAVQTMLYPSVRFVSEDLKQRNLFVNDTGLWYGDHRSASVPFCCQDLRCYDSALSVKEVRQIAQGLALHYKLDGVVNTGTVEKDVSGFGHDATRSGVTYNSEGFRYTKYSVMDGSAGKVYSDSFAYNGYVHTSSIWFKVLSLSGTSPYFLFALNDSGSYADCQLGLAFDGTHYYGAVGGTAGSVSGSATFSVGTVHNLAMVRDASTCKIYLDGELVSTTSVSDSVSGKTHLCLGARCSNSSGSGSGAANYANVGLSDFRLYATPLAAEDIKALYNATSIDNMGKLHCLEVLDV